MSVETRAALLMSLCMAAFSVNDAIMKALGQSMPLGQALFLRGVGATLLVGLWASYRGQLVPTLGPRERRLIAWRALFEVAASVFFLTAVFNMPLANATAILQTVPLVVALGAGLFLGEALERRTYAAIGLGLAGVLLILRPGTEGFNVFALSALAAVLSVAARDLVTRSFPVHLPTLTAAVWSAAAVGLSGLPLGLAETWITPTPRLWALVCAASVTILAAVLLSLAAMRAGSAGASAPFRYTALVWSLLLGFVLFGEWPQPLALAGAALVALAGLAGLWAGASAGKPRGAR